ncbi:MAG: AMP-binding protein, partial [Chloroflexi bacterium]|nr:AMP-binding protein [Chloroflexota bacterium]
YGWTETSPVTNADFAEIELRRAGSVGPSLPDTDEKVVDLDAGKRELPRGEVGELIVRGPQVMQGYWNNPEATAETIRDGWLHTGDMATMDEEGYVYIVDRKKELIKYKGFQVPPAELEALLLEHPAITDAAVVGKPDEEAGELPKAYVVTKDPDVTADEIMEFVAERVAGFKKIREVEFIDEIPKNPSGKILRRVLVEKERERARG